MYRQLLALSAALLLTLSSSSTEASSSSSTSSSPSSYIRKQPNAYIVELQGRDTNEFFASYPGAKVRYTYDSDILHGASVEFSDPAAAKRALSHKDVVNAWQVGHHTRPSATAGASFHRNDNNNRTFQPLDPDQIQTLTGYSNASRQLNVDGSSVRVGIIDSGVDYRHPALGGCFGTGCRIAYGYDLVGDDYDGSPDSIRPDADPLDDCPAGAVGATGHGTFVTGLIGAIDKNYNWTGAAPGAQLGMWRVFGCKSQVSTTDVFIKAMEMAYKADMDVINLSLGENGGWEEDVLAVFADRLVARGVHVVVATGNIGTSGIFLAASPSTGRNVIAVGSLMNTHLPAYILNVTRIDGKYKTDSLAIPYRTIDNSALVQPNATSLVFASDDSDDKCIDKDLDVDDNIVLVPQDGCNLDKQIAAYSKASVIVAYSSSNDSSPTSYSSSGSSSKSPAVAFISGADAKQLFAFVHNSSSNKKKKKHDRPLEAQLTSLLVSVPAPESQAGRFAGFTSLGPTNELRIKPEICALGSDLLSTFPLNLGSYGFLSGTSTSAPLVSAYVALLVDSFKGQKLTAQIVKDSLLNFASPLKSPVLAYPSLGDAPVRQGAGAINVARAVQGLSQFHVSPSALSFNDTEHFEPTQTLTIYNHAKEVLEFRMVHGAALTTAGYDLKNASDFTPQEPISLGVQDPTVATVTFSKNQLSVPAGGSAEVQVNLKVSTHVFAPNSHAIYGGYIGVELDNGSIAASIPYIGMIGNMTDLPILDRSSGSSDLAYPFPSIGNPDGSILGTKETGHYSPGRWPTLLVRLLTGTPLVDVQVLDEHKKLLGSVPYNAMNADSTHEWLPRNTKAATSSSTPYEAWVWTGQYVEQDSSSKEVRTVSSGGVYYLRVRALRVFGDRTSDRDWDTWTSPPMKMNLNSNSSNSSSQSSSTTTTSSIKPSYKPTDTALPISIVI